MSLEKRNFTKDMEYSDRKVSRKQARCTKYISEETGINFPPLPRKALLICNAGLVSGLQREQVLELFQPFGTIENVVMLPGKSYCFVEFHDTRSGEQAFKSLHGKSALPSSSAVIYLAYADKVPECRNEWSASLPPGLIVLPDFISEKEETLLISVFEKWRGDSNTEKSLKNRDVQHFGFEFRYGSNDVDPSKPLERGIPEECSILWSYLKKRYSLDYQPDQLTVNYYKEGQGIPRHVDTHSAFEDPILSLSLGSDIVMDWNSTDNKFVPVVLPRRSMLVMSDEARYGWTHGIVPRKFDIVPSSEGGLTVVPRGYRISLTFRKLRSERVCNCRFAKLCDYQKSQGDTNSDGIPAISSLGDKEASELEANYVHQVYEKIGSHFSVTRSKPWPNVLEFVLSFPAGSVLFDVGCGNGKYFGQRGTTEPKIFEVGCDTSACLADVCLSRGFEVMLSNCLALPLRSNSVDACISIAVIHHLSTEVRRRRAISEINRILRPGGRALIYVWARDQARGKTKSTYLKQDRKNRRDETLVCDDTGKPASVPVPEEESSTRLDGKLSHFALPVHTNRTQFKHRDVLVPWKLKHKADDYKASEVPEVVATQDGEATSSIESGHPPTFLRFYHVFEEGELEALCLSVIGVRLQHSYYDQGNWCVIFEKVVAQEG